MHCIMYIIGPPTGGKQGERIYIHPTGKGGRVLWRQNLLILVKFFNPDVGGEIVSFWKETADFAEIYEHLKLRVTE